MSSENVPTLRRRQLLKWLALSPTLPVVQSLRGAELTAPGTVENPAGEKPADWDLLLNPEEIRCLSVLCDLIIPEDAHSPAASELGITDFLNEWISAPFPPQMLDRITIRGGLVWLDGECRHRHAKSFVALDPSQQRALCDDIQKPDDKKPEFLMGTRFFTRLRELTCSGFYTTPEGRRDLNYQGNVPLSQFNGPPPEVLEVLEVRLKALGL